MLLVLAGQMQVECCLECIQMYAFFSKLLYIKGSDFYCNKVGM